MRSYRVSSTFFFFNDTATTEIYTLSLHDALPICRGPLLAAPLEQRLELVARDQRRRGREQQVERAVGNDRQDRKSTRLNSSHGYISYAVFCLKKKKRQISGRVTCTYQVYSLCFML